MVLVAYTATTTDAEADRASRISGAYADGKQRICLTQTADSNEWRPQWSADSSQLAFLSIAA
jgi:hypothetical protein